MTQTIVIPGRLDGATEYQKAWRTPGTTTRNAELVRAALEHYRVKPSQDVERVEITFYERPERGERARTVQDVTGGAPFIMDALQAAGVVPDGTNYTARGYLANEGMARVVVTLVGA